MEKYDLWKTTPPEPTEPPSCKVCDKYMYSGDYDTMLCYDCSEDQNKEEENEMNMNAVELIKMELCSRYGINPEQIQVDVSIWDVETPELADQIKKDYEVPGKAYNFLDSYKGYNMDYEDGSQSQYIVGADHGSYARNENILNITVRTKNGVTKDE